MKHSSHSGPTRTPKNESLRSESLRSERVRYESSMRHDPHYREAHIEREHIDREDAVRAKKPSRGTQRLQSTRARHAKQRVRAKVLAYVIPTLLFSLFLMAMTSVVAGDWRRFNGEVGRNEAQLKVLEAQLETGQRRLSVLESDKGREQLLIENGYLRPGERILLFPPDEIEKQEMQPAPNDLSPRPRVISSGNNGSPWQRATRTISQWFSNMRSAVAPASAPASATKNSASSNAG